LIPCKPTEAKEYNLKADEFEYKVMKDRAELNNTAAPEIKQEQRKIINDKFDEGNAKILGAKQFRDI